MSAFLFIFWFSPFLSTAIIHFFVTTHRILINSMSIQSWYCRRSTADYVRYLKNTNNRIIVEWDQVADLGRLTTSSCYIAKANEEVMRNYLTKRLRCCTRNTFREEATKHQSDIHSSVTKRPKCIKIGHLCFCYE